MVAIMCSRCSEIQATNDCYSQSLQSELATNDAKISRYEWHTMHAMLMMTIDESTDQISCVVYSEGCGQTEYFTAVHPEGKLTPDYAQVRGANHFLVIPLKMLEDFSETSGVNLPQAKKNENQRAKNLEQVLHRTQ